MFDFIHDRLALIYLATYILSIVGVVFSIRFVIRVHKGKYNGRHAMAGPVGIAVFGVILTFFPITFFVRAYAVYDVVLVGAVQSDSTFINSKYAEQRKGHFYSLVVYHGHAIKTNEDYRRVYRAYEKDRAASFFRNGLLPFIGESTAIQKDKNLFPHAYPEMSGISLSIHDEVAVLKSSNVDGHAHFAKSKSSAKKVSEGILGKSLPDDALGAVNLSGDSAGLMIALELIQQFGDKDLLKGYKICGTGTIDENGDVGIIGALKMKLIYANEFEDGNNRHLQYCFVSEKDYSDALKIKMDEKLDLEIVPIKNIKDALQFLDKLEEKPWLQN